MALGAPSSTLVVLGAAIYGIFDYEFPGIGLARIDPVDRVSVETLKKMN